MHRIRMVFARIQKKVEFKKWLASFVSAFKQKAVLIGIGALALICAIGIILFGLLAHEPSEQEGVDIPTSQIIRHPLTGEILEAALEELPHVFAVMVENSADAWPLAGLDKAFLVIEAPVEGSIPRCIAFYSEENDVQKVGPVRSARPYYLDWAEEFQAMYAHVGGSPEALESIEENEDFLDLNQFWNGEYFYRENGDRFAPHNVYTDSELLTEAYSTLFEDEFPTYDVWKFAEGEPVDDPHSVTIDWSDGTAYDVTWQYDASQNAYTRLQGDGIMEMEDGSRIIADNIVILATDIRVIDNEGRRRITTQGEGDALMVQNGEMYVVRWSKDGPDDRLKFSTADGFDISFNPGVTWIEVVSSLSQVQTFEMDHERIP